jgi:hypothetical protein
VSEISDVSSAEPCDRYDSLQPEVKGLGLTHDIGENSIIFSVIGNLLKEI